MTVASEVNRAGPYACNGTTVIFPFGFKIYDQSHVKVILIDSVGVETVLILGTDYSVTGVNNDAGGSIVAATAYPAGKTITILLDVPFTQDIDLENQGAYYAEVVERGLDLVTQRLLQLQERLNRAFIAPPNNTQGATMDPAILDQVSGNAAAILTAAALAGDQAALARASAGAAAGSATAASLSADDAEYWAGQAAVFGGTSYTSYLFTATAGQSVFTFGTPLSSTLGMVFINGVSATGGGDDYTLTTAAVTLTVPASAGDIVKVYAFSSFAVANVLTPANNLSELPNKAAARTNLGLGTAATKNIGDVTLMPSGSVIGRAYAEYTATTVYNNIIPPDTTIPQITEGVEILTATYTPKVAGSKLRVTFGGVAQVAGTGNSLMASTFLNGGANAVDTTLDYHYADSDAHRIATCFEISPSGLTPQTLAVRVGTSGGSSFKFNAASASTYGGTMKTTLIVEEIMP